MMPKRVAVSERALSTAAPQHGVEVEAGAGLQDGRVEGGGALAQRPVLAAQLVGSGHGITLAAAAQRAVAASVLTLSD